MPFLTPWRSHEPNADEDQLAGSVAASAADVADDRHRRVRQRADPFHVVRDANKRVDGMRRVCEEVYFYQNGARKKIPKRVLEKTNEKLSSSGRTKLETILKENESLEVFYRFKEKIRDVYKSVLFQTLSDLNENFFVTIFD